MSITSFPFWWLISSFRATSLYLWFGASIEGMHRAHHVKCWAGWISIGINIKSWNKYCWEKYQQPQICRWHHPYGRKRRRRKEPLDESERGQWKSWLKIQHSENSITSWQIDGEAVETVTDFILGGSISLQMVTAAMKLEDTCLLEEKIWPT